LPLPVPTAIALPEKQRFIVAKDKTSLWDLTTNPDYKSVKTFNLGDELEVVGYIPFNGTRYMVTEYSFIKGIKNGINIADLTAKPVPEPIPEPVEPEPTPDPIIDPKPPKEPETPPSDDNDQPIPNWFVQILLSLVDFIANLIKGVKK
jgi:hypothetical protein